MTGELPGAVLPHFNPITQKSAKLCLKIHESAWKKFAKGEESAAPPVLGGCYSEPEVNEL